MEFFKDGRGDEYFMATNLWHQKEESAATCAQTVTINFSPDVKTVWRLFRETGTSEKLFTRDGKLQLRLPGGTGDLFKFRGGKFSGLSDVE